jgi:hypothetical protein
MIAMPLAFEDSMVAKEWSRSLRGISSLTLGTSLAMMTNGLRLSYRGT